MSETSVEQGFNFLIKTFLLLFGFLIIFLVVVGDILSKWNHKWEKNLSKDVERETLAEWEEDR